MQTKIFQPTTFNLRRLAAALRRGGVVAVPTETVYGLAANALDPAACRRIFLAKKRPAYDPLIVHVPNLAAAERLAHWNDTARSLARKFWPGPLTLVLPKRDLVPGIVTSNRDSVALRCPAHPVMRRLLRIAGVPLAAPSANLFGAVSPTTAAHVADGLGGRIPHIIDGGTCAIGVESTIVDVRRPERPVVLRPGEISRQQIAQAAKASRVGRVTRSGRGAPDAPGMLERHYSPDIPLVIVPFGRLSQVIPKLAASDAVLFYRRPRSARVRNAAQCYWLTDSDGAEAAHSLYEKLRAIDRSGARRALVELAPASAGPIAEAINDRLSRSAGRGQG